MKTFDETYQAKKDLYGKPYRELQDFFTKRTSRGELLDLGCGQGRDAIFLASIGYKVTAVDTSSVGVQQMIEKAAKAKLEVTGITGDILDIQIKTDFDVILFDMLLHSFKNEDTKRAIEKYARIVKDGGIICIVLPDDVDPEFIRKTFESLQQNWILKEKIVIRDVPKIDDEVVDFTFIMIVFELAH